MRTALALLLAGLAIGGCATKPMTVECDPFRARYAKPVPRSATMVEIQSGAEPVVGAQARNSLVASLDSTLSAAFMRDGNQGPALLALSGGGQWGAFGAAYLEELDSQSGTKLPKFDIITGVSTGALQALFVGAAQADENGRAAYLAELTRQYSPESEREIAHRTHKYLAPIKGAVAKLGPLRRRIEAALCTKSPADPSAPGACPLIERLAAPGAPTVLLGFVAAATGEMQYINVTQIAREAVAPAPQGPRIDMTTAQQCITGGALASVAMPFFYQQVQVASLKPDSDEPAEPVTYLDGGVRQSMFLVETTLAATELAARKRTASSAPLIHLVRNGPTVALPDPDADGKRDAISSAERGYSLIVNQSEVMAIETIRLRYAEADIKLATADGYDRPFPQGSTRFCRKEDSEAMFEPGFMKCLQALGRHKAGDDAGDPKNGWIILTSPR